MTTTTIPKSLEVDDGISPVVGKGRITTLGISLYEQELEYVDRLGAIYGLSRSAVIRQIINNARMTKFTQEQG